MDHFSKITQSYKYGPRFLEQKPAKHSSRQFFILMPGFIHDFNQFSMLHTFISKQLTQIQRTEGLDLYRISTNFYEKQPISIFEYAKLGAGEPTWAPLEWLGQVRIGQTISYLRKLLTFGHHPRPTSQVRLGYIMWIWPKIHIM